MSTLDQIASYLQYFGVVLSFSGCLITALSKRWGENKSWIILGVSLALVGCLISAYQTYQNQRELGRRDAARRQVYLQLAEASGAFGSALAMMAFNASGPADWYPTNEEELYSRKSVDLICDQLDQLAMAPTFPKTSWASYISEQTLLFHSRLNRAFDSHSDVLDQETIEGLSALERAAFFFSQFEGGPTWIAELNGTGEIPNIALCSGGMKQPVEAAFSTLYGFHKLVTKTARELNSLPPESLAIPFLSPGNSERGSSKWSPSKLFQ
jgi:hypothetical protein